MVCVSTYIAFNREYFDDNAVIPEGFIYDKKRRTVFHEYKSRRLTQEAFEKEKRDHIEKLLLWCKDLPELSDSNHQPRAVLEQKM